MVDFTVGVVAALSIDKAIGWIHVKKVATGCGTFVEPTLRPGMLTVPTVTFFLVASTDTVKTVVIVGIDVPNFAIGVTVGVGKGIEKTSVADDVVSFDNAMQGKF